MDIGELIKKARKNAKLTQKQLAEKIDVAEITIRQYENNKRSVSFAMFSKISDSLDLSFQEMLMLTDSTHGKATSDVIKRKTEELYSLIEKKDEGHPYTKELKLFNEIVDLNTIVHMKQHIDDGKVRHLNTGEVVIDKELFTQLESTKKELEKLTQAIHPTDNITSTHEAAHELLLSLSEPRQKEALNFLKFLKEQNGHIDKKEGET